MAVQARVDEFHGEDKDGAKRDKGERRFTRGTHPNLCGHRGGSGEMVEVGGESDAVFASLS